MTLLALILQFILAMTFFWAGVLKIGGHQMHIENFKRWQLSDSLRPITGWFELIGAILMGVGLWVSSWAAWGGLWIAIIMVCAAYVHIRIKDKLSNIVSPLFLAAGSLLVTWIHRTELLNFPF